MPDGTDVQGFNGEPDSNSNLRAYLDGIYGNEATWLPILQSIFDRWSQVSGITYVYEPNDDGAALRNPEDVNNPGTFLPSPYFGQAGVRGDVRISGHTIDGNSGVLAYNFYPDSGDATGGDMVIDTGDNFFTNTSGNSLRLRNVVSHEHGHGMGQPHVCPIETSKLMEPFVSAAYDGPRHDDIRHAQFSYGDIYEPNDDEFTATPLAIGDCGTLVVGTLPTPAGPTAGDDPAQPHLHRLALRRERHRLLRHHRHPGHAALRPHASLGPRVRRFRSGMLGPVRLVLLRQSARLAGRHRCRHPAL